jgi:hypothetical protein
MMEAARTSETLVNFYQTTRRSNPEDSHLRDGKMIVNGQYARILREAFVSYCTILSQRVEENRKDLRHET